MVFQKKSNDFPIVAQGFGANMLKLSVGARMHMYEAHTSTYIKHFILGGASPHPPGPAPPQASRPYPSTHIVGFRFPNRYTKPEKTVKRKPIMAEKNIN